MPKLSSKVGLEASRSTMSPSALLNKCLRRYVSPVLRDAGFQRIDARNGWRWGNTIWVVNVRAVGRYFADVTGWPPSSIGVWLGVFYPFVPTAAPAKQAEGLPLPAEHECHMRSRLERTLPQDALTSTSALTNAAERERRDLWWVDPAGSNVDEVAADVASVALATAIPWFERSSNLRAALSMVQAERDCFSKFVLAAHLAERTGDAHLLRQYRALAEAEAQRIGVQPDPGGWCWRRSESA